MVSATPRLRARRSAELPNIATPPRLLRPDAYVFVLRFVALLDRFFPLDLIVVVGLALPGQVVGLALVAALLVDGHGGLLATGDEADRSEDEHKTDGAAPHDFCAGFGACCCSGLPYAVPQPHTSEPFPRVSTRVR